jgi:tRNA(fMet)-specific endonuclease VapC
LLVLDTDHLVEIDRGSAIGRALLDRLVQSDEQVVTTIISAEEQLRGWLAQINRKRDPAHQIDAYARLQGRVAFFAAWRLLPWDMAAAQLFREFRGQGIRIGSMDLKIACIVLMQEATLLTRNLADFRQVPGLMAEDWL